MSLVSSSPCLRCSRPCSSGACGGGCSCFCSPALARSLPSALSGAPWFPSGSSVPSLLFRSSGGWWGSAPLLSGSSSPVAPVFGSSAVVVCRGGLPWSLCFSSSGSWVLCGRASLLRCCFASRSFALWCGGRSRPSGCAAAFLAWAVE